MGAPAWIAEALAGFGGDDEFNAAATALLEALPLDAIRDAIETSATTVLERRAIRDGYGDIGRDIAGNAAPAIMAALSHPHTDPDDFAGEYLEASIALDSAGVPRVVGGELSEGGTRLKLHERVRWLAQQRPKVVIAAEHTRQLACLQLAKEALVGLFEAIDEGTIDMIHEDDKDGIECPEDDTCTCPISTWTPTGTLRRLNHALDAIEGKVEP